MKAHLRLKQKEIIPLYAAFLRGRLTMEEMNSFIRVFNRLLMAYWSLSGLQRIKEAAWKLHDLEKLV